MWSSSNDITLPLSMRVEEINMERLLGNEKITIISSKLLLFSKCKMFIDSTIANISLIDHTCNMK